jgi:hypothetical protein
MRLALEIELLSEQPSARMDERFYAWLTPIVWR